jgi:hypothetical protein
LLEITTPRVGYSKAGCGRNGGTFPCQRITSLAVLLEKREDVLEAIMDRGLAAVLLPESGKESQDAIPGDFIHESFLAVLSEQVE